MAAGLGEGESGAHLVLGEELPVPPLQDVQLGVVQVWVLIAGPILLPDKAAPEEADGDNSGAGGSQRSPKSHLQKAPRFDLHSGPPLGGELAMEDDDHTLARIKGHDGLLQQELLHVLLHGQIDSTLRGGGRGAFIPQPPRERREPLQALVLHDPWLRP